MGVVLYGQIWIKGKIGKFSSMYPPSTDCNTFVAFSETELEKVAILDKNNTLEYHGMGGYYCFCSKHYTFLSTERLNLVDTSLCGDHHTEKRNSQAFSILLSIGVVIVNIMMVSVGTQLTSIIHFHLNDEIVTNITTLIFFMQFMNTAVLIMVSDASLENTPLKWLGKEGSYSDYQEEWYFTVAKQI